MRRRLVGALVDPMLQVTRRGARIEGVGLKMKRNPLGQLAHALLAQQPVKLGLAEQNDRNQLGFVGLVIAQEPHRLQAAAVQALRFVDDKHARAALGVLGDQIPRERLIGLLARARIDLKFGADIGQAEKYRETWRAQIERHAVPELGPMLVQDIEMQDVLRVLQPLWGEKTETASKLRQRIEAVLSWATVHGYRTGDNPARWAGNLKMVLPAPSKVAGAQNFPALELGDVPRWWQALRARDGMGARALAFQAMTATRSGAIRFATWSEIDLKAKVWTIQPGREASKIAPSDKPKRVPLTADMVALLEALPRLDGCDLVFWAPKGGALSDATLSKVMRVIHEADTKAGGKGFVDAATGEQAVPHGLRSTFRTWVSERTEFDGDMAEVALFHKVGSKVQQAYDRADKVERRRGMMRAWCDFLAGKAPQKVVSLAEARA